MKLAERSLQGASLDLPELAKLLGEEVPLLPLLHEAWKVRNCYFGNRVQIHILNNGRNARCPEDCGYCAQSSVSQAPVQPYEWKSKQELLQGARDAFRAGAYRYCMVGSGRGPTRHQIGALADAIRLIKREVPVQICVSVGRLDEEQARILEQAGVDRVNHNLNTSRRNYPRICSTHGYDDRLATLRAARSAGLQVCCGIIAGMGETDFEIAELAMELHALQVPSIPVNFLVPVAGNPMRSDGSLSPERCLRVLAMFRLANPEAEIRAAGGREGHLRSLEPLALYPANSLFIDGYLTTRGEGALTTYRMIRDAGFVVECPAGQVASWHDLGLDDVFRIEGDEQILKPEVHLPEL